MGATANRSIPEDKEKFYKRNQELKSLELTPKHYHNALKLYDMKCKSIGEIVDPFNFVLTPHTTFVDPVHWESIENLLEFMKHFPTNALAAAIRNLLYLTIFSILDASEELFPKNIFEEEEEKAIQLFIENINVINERVEKVDDDDAPPKLIDLFHRLLALSKLDKLWIKINVSKKPEINSSLCNIYTKLADLENENRLLRNEISSNQI
ncbi:hypothetical protein AVEN_15700-1 [Araneus ventricosus]|uniref:Uncharacterized protein n=1 Tax=Araneus ventricosus TaxID=182803 RepID=A0A4Y2JN56_ARAVE|nr:hypothetical protein AVEN_15700-1 [Araneus ventricosus]